jgi:hypothetical protein
VQRKSAATKRYLEYQSKVFENFNFYKFFSNSRPAMAPLAVAARYHPVHECGSGRVKGLCLLIVMPHI